MSAAQEYQAEVSPALVRPTAASRAQMARRTSTLPRIVCGSITAAVSTDGWNLSRNLMKLFFKILMAMFGVASLQAASPTFQSFNQQQFSVSSDAQPIISLVGGGSSVSNFVTSITGSGAASVTSTSTSTGVVANVFVSGGGGGSSGPVTNIVFTNLPSATSVAIASGTNSMLFLPATNGVSSVYMTGTNDQIVMGGRGEYNIFLQSAHSGDEELQIGGAGRIALLPGYDQRHISIVQMGSGTFGGSQGDAAPFEFLADYVPSSASDLGGMGYSKTIILDSAYRTNGNIGLSSMGFRVHSIDTNGTTAMSFYNLANPSSSATAYIYLAGAIPWPVSGFEIYGGYGVGSYGNGVAIHGRETHDIPETSPITSYGVDWEASRDSMIDASGNLAFTNVTGIWPRTNSDDVRNINISVGLVNITASFPSGWLWSGAVPTSMINQEIYKITVERIIANATNYLANCSLIYTNTFSFDANALAYITAAGITNQSQKYAINAFCVAAKNHGYYTNLVAFYPVLGGNTNTASYDLITAAQRGNFNGTSTVTASGMASDGTSGYFNSTIIPNTVYGSLSSASFGMAIASTNAIAAGQFAGCDNNSTVLFGPQNTYSASTLYSFSGPDSFSYGGPWSVSGTVNFNGVLGFMQVSTTSCDHIVNGVIGAPDGATATAMCGQPIYFEANNHNGSVTSFSTAVENSIFVANYMTVGLMNNLIADINTMNASLGR